LTYFRQVRGMHIVLVIGQNSWIRHIHVYCYCLLFNYLSWW